MDSSDPQDQSESGDKDSTSEKKKSNSTSDKNQNTTEEPSRSLGSSPSSYSPKLITKSSKLLLSPDARRRLSLERNHFIGLNRKVQQIQKSRTESQDKAAENNNNNSINNNNLKSVVEVKEVTAPMASNWKKATYVNPSSNPVAATDNQNKNDNVATLSNQPSSPTNPTNNTPTNPPTPSNPPSGSPLTKTQSNSSSSSSSKDGVPPRTTVIVDQLKESSLLALLAENGFSDQDIWEGDPRLFPILYQFKETLESIPPLSNDNVITFNFPASLVELAGVNKKSYKIAHTQPAHQVISSICKRLGITDPHSYALTTLRGFTLNDSTSISSYGFGTLFRHWELKLVRRTDQPTYRKTISAGRSHTTHKSTVTIQFPPLPEFKGLKAKTLRVEIHTTVQNLLDAICKRYEVTGSERFVLSTNYSGSVYRVSLNTSSNEVEDLVLRGEAELAAYGLGSRFDNWELRLVFKDSVASLPHDRIINHSKYRWILVENSNAKMNDVREVLVQLENQLGERETIVERLVAENESLQDRYSKLESSWNSSKNEITYLKSQVESRTKENEEISLNSQDLLNKLVNEKNLNMKLSGNLSETSFENSKLTSQLEKIFQELSETKSKHESKIETLTTELNFLREELENSKNDLRNRDDTLFQLSLEKESLKSSLSSLSRSKEESESHYKNTITQLEISKDNYKANSLLLEEMLTKRAKEKEELLREIENAQNGKSNEEVRLRSKVDELQKKLNDAVDKIYKMSDALETERKMRSGPGASSATTLSTIGQSSSSDPKIQNLNSQIEQLTSALESSKLEISNLRNRISSTSDSNADESSSYIDKIKNLEALLESEKKKSSLSSSSLEMQNTELNQLRNESKEIRMQKEKSDDQVRTLLSELSSLKDSNHSLNRELTSTTLLFARREDELRKQMSDLISKVERLTSDNARERESFQAELRIVNMQVESLSNEKEKLKNNLSVTKTLYEERIEELNKEIEELRKPPPPPVPQMKVVENKRESGETLGAEILQKRGALSKTTITQRKTDAMDGPTTIATLIYSKLQQRFFNVGSETDVEELDEVEADVDWK